MFQSETFVLIDALYNDTVSSDTSTSYYANNCTLSFSNDKFVITRSANGQCHINLLTSVLSLSSLVGKSLKFECDILEATANVRVQIYQQVSGSWSNVNSSYTTNGTVSVQADTDANATAVQFRLDCSNLGTDGTCSFRNFKIYYV